MSGAPATLAAMIRRLVRRAVPSGLRRGGRLDVAVVDAPEMRRQHARWLGRRTVTDVLTFDLRDPEGVGPIDGQLLVCTDVARRRVRRLGGDWRREMLLYIVHGCLHLCGYDDRSPRQADRMHQREDAILRALGVGPVFSAGGRSHRSSRAGRLR